MRRKRSEVESRHSSQNDARSRSGYFEYRKSNSDRISAKVPRAFQGRRKIAGGTAPIFIPFRVQRTGRYKRQGLQGFEDRGVRIVLDLLVEFVSKEYLADPASDAEDF